MTYSWALESCQDAEMRIITLTCMLIVSLGTRENLLHLKRLHKMHLPLLVGEELLVVSYAHSHQALS